MACSNMNPAKAQGYDSRLLQRINAANSQLFGGLPATRSRPVLLQSLVDLWCADGDAVKLSFAAAAVQATAAAASAAVLSALLSGAQVAQAMARGDTAAAGRAAAEVTALAGTAVTPVQQLQVPVLLFGRSLRPNAHSPHRVQWLMAKLLTDLDDLLLYTFTYNAAACEVTTAVSNTKFHFAEVQTCV